MANKNNNLVCKTFLRRLYQTNTIAGTTGNTVQGTNTFTATERVVIRGWKAFTSGDILAPTDATTPTNWDIYAEVTKATTLNSDYMLDRAGAKGGTVTNAAGAENVGGWGLKRAVMDTKLSREEALELGLLLDYGESLRHIAACVQNSSSTDNFISSILWFYEVIPPC